MSRYLGDESEQLIAVPGRIRPPDCSIASHGALGRFGVGVQWVPLAEGETPFDITLTDSSLVACRDELAWLPALRAAGLDALAVDWLAQCFKAHPRRLPSLPPERRGRRLLALLTEADLVLGDIDGQEHGRRLRAIADDLHGLRAQWHTLKSDRDRLSVLIATCTGAVCLAVEEHVRQDIETILARELSHQFHADGIHVSRNAADTLEVILDLVPLLRVYAYRDLEPPVEIASARRRLQSGLRSMRTGELTLARFNGVGLETREFLALASKLDPDAQAVQGLMASGYARLHADATVLIADAGSAPTSVSSHAVFAGFGSFEFSSGGCQIICNCGAEEPTTPNPAPADGWYRATSAHSTLVLNGQSLMACEEDNGDRVRTIRTSSPRPRATRPPGLKVECCPGNVRQANTTLQTGDHDGRNAHRLSLTHDGYVGRFGARHGRELQLSTDGTQLWGRDRLYGAHGPLRLSTDIAYAIHFHLAPSCEIETTDTRNEVLIHLADGRQTWAFLCDVGQVYVEDSRRPAARGARSRAFQIVVRGLCPGEADVRWLFEKRTGP